MSALASLVSIYDRLLEEKKVPAFGYSQEKIGFLISLNEDGTPAGKPIDLRDGEGKKKTARPIAVPQPVKRTSGIAPNFLWDKTAYVLGVTAGEVKRTAKEHAEFIARHEEWLAGTEDAGLRALLSFLRDWKPEDFERLGWPDEMKDQNIVFALESERRRDIMIHDRPAARELWARISAAGDRTQAACLVTGEHGPIARLHPAIKGVWGGQSSGGSIVSFNLDAFTSYGHEQGDNAPVSEAAAFAYTTALNRFLEKGSGHRVPIGDTSTIFWAEADDPADAATAEAFGGAFFGVDEKDTTDETKRIKSALENIAEGKAPSDTELKLPENVRFYVLGLAPNASRLSVRFYHEGSFGALAKRCLDHIGRMRIEPPPREALPSIWRLLIETAPLRKTENVQPNLAGEWLRAILEGAPYPTTLLATLIMRLRADHDINALRVAMMKSVLIRNFGMEETPVALDLDCKEPGYLLGRLFATYEQVQSAALGGVNAGVREKFYGAASSMPRKVFHILDANSANHLSKLGKASPGYRVTLEKQIGAIMEMMSPGDDPFPAQLPEKQQALFGLGYYHQRNFFFRGRDKAGPDTGTKPDTKTEETSA